MYTKIVNPITNTYVDIHTKQGNDIILNYLNYSQYNSKNILQGGAKNNVVSNQNMENPCHALIFG